MSTRRRWGNGVVAAFVLVTSLVGVDCAAQADDAADQTVTIQDGVASESQQPAGDDYWTPERLASAVPVELVDASVAPTTEVAAQVGEPTDDPAVVRHWFPPTRAPLGIRPTAEAESAVEVPKPYTNMPDRTVGRVFFTDDRGRDRSCSGVALQSDNKSVVWTAGHCVESGGVGGFHINWIFIPAFGSCGETCEPFGRFSATKLFTTEGWATAGDFRVDLGAAVVAPHLGRKLTQKVGGQGLVTGLPARRWSVARIRNVGYPADAPFDGLLQWMCVGTTTGRDSAVAGSGPDPVSMSCDMAGGASGGPWILGLGRNGYGHVAGVTSYRYRRDRSTVYSPALGDEAAALYRQAATAKVRG